MSQLKAKLNEKKFDKVRKERPEFMGGSFLAESRKVICTGWMAVVHKPKDRSIVKDEHQMILQSWLHHCLRTFINMEFKDTENLTVPTLLKSGEEKIIMTHESMIDAGLDSELKHQKLTMKTSISGIREDSFEKSAVKTNPGLFVETITWKKVTTYKKIEKITETITHALGLFEDVELREHLDVTEEVLEEEVEEVRSYKENKTDKDSKMRGSSEKGESAEAALVQNTLALETDQVKGKNFVPSLRQERWRKEMRRHTAETSCREIDENEAETVNATFTSPSYSVYS